MENWTGIFFTIIIFSREIREFFFLLQRLKPIFLVFFPSLEAEKLPSLGRETKKQVGMP